MFSLASGKPYSDVLAVTAPRKYSNKKSSSVSSPLRDMPLFPESLEPAIDGPPSSERIRAYTEQMKRSSIFGNNSRTNTLSSGTSSFRSQLSTLAPSDDVSLSRRSSGRSNTSSVLRRDRPESVISTLFSRTTRRSKKENRAAIIRNITSAGPQYSDYSNVDEESAKEHYYGKKNCTRRRNPISNPYNFQHVTHTRQDHLPDLGRATGAELVSEFSAMRAGQAPTRGELKGIRADDLHFENFSSEALSVIPSEEALAASNRPSPQFPVVPYKGFQPLQRSSQRPMGIAKSHDNLRSAPVRPPRSPLAFACPLELPTRTSSRTAAAVSNTFDQLATNSIARTNAQEGFRKPSPLVVPSPVVMLESQSDDVATAMTSPTTGAWPLITPLSGTFGVELPDVKEEEEEAASIRSQGSTASAELRRVSKSVPALRQMSEQQSFERPGSRMSTTLGMSPSKDPMSASELVSPVANPPVNDSWESDIDWCYENEVEADCEFKWDQCSAVGENPTEIVPAGAQPSLQLSLQTEERAYHGRFRPSLLLPSADDTPELSPWSSSSPWSSASTPSMDPCTPTNFLKPMSVRPPSRASSFKESQGFHLSPSLLIPTDFKSQMEQDACYSEHYNRSLCGTIYAQDAFVHAITSVDESHSSVSSHRSSGFSRRSTRSSSGTHMSGMSSETQDSLVPSRSSSRAHRSLASTSSLPDLVPSTLRQLDHDLASNLSIMAIANANVESTISPSIAGPGVLPHRRSKSLFKNQQFRNGDAPSTVAQKDVMSPVNEAFPDIFNDGKSLAHGRKISAPEPARPIPVYKSRARASTAVAVGGHLRRESYVLSPQF